MVAQKRCCLVEYRVAELRREPSVGYPDDMQCKSVGYPGDVQYRYFAVAQARRCLIECRAVELRRQPAGGSSLVAP